MTQPPVVATADGPPIPAAESRRGAGARVLGLYGLGGVVLVGVTLWLAGWMFPTAGSRWLIAVAVCVALVALRAGLGRGSARLGRILLATLVSALCYLVALAAAVWLTAGVHEATAASLLGRSLRVPLVLLLSSGVPIGAIAVGVVVAALQRTLTRSAARA